MPRTGRSRFVTYTTTIACTGSAVYTADYQAGAADPPISQVEYSYAGRVAPRWKLRVVDTGEDYFYTDPVSGHESIERRGNRTQYLDYGWVDSFHDPFRTSGTFWKTGEMVISSVDYDTGTNTPVLPPHSTAVDYYVNKYSLFTWSITGTITQSGTLYETVQLPFNGYENAGIGFGEEQGDDWETVVDLPGVDDAGLVTVKPDVISGAPVCGGTTNANFQMRGVDGTEDHPYLGGNGSVAQAAYFNANQAPLGGSVSATFSTTVSGDGMAFTPDPPAYTASGCTVSMGTVSVKSPERGVGYSADGEFHYVLDQTISLNAQNRIFEREDTSPRSLWFLFGLPDPGPSVDPGEVARAKPLTVTGHGGRSAVPRGGILIATVYAPTGTSTNDYAYGRTAPAPDNAVVPTVYGANLSVRDNSEKSASNPPFGLIPQFYQTTFYKTVNSIGIYQLPMQDLESAPFILGTTVPAEARPKGSVWTGTNVTLTGGSGPLSIVVGSGAVGSAWTRYRATASPQLYIRNGYRRYRIRIRSVGSANQPFSPVFCDASTGSGSTEPKSDLFFGILSTGADGEWVERTIDLLNLPANSAPFTQPYAARSAFAPEHPLTGFRLDSLAAGKTYELQFVRGERIAESLINVWGGAAILTDDPFQSQNLHILHGLTDGMVSLNVPSKLSSAPGFHVIKIAQMIDLINAQPWTGWRATDLNPPTAGRDARATANTLTLDDYHDSTGMPASFLECTGLRPDFSLALDLNVTASTAGSSYVLKASYQALSVTLYPGCGDAMGGGGYSVSSSLDFRRCFGSQVFGVVVGSSGSGKIQVKDTAAAVAIRGEGAVRSSGSYTTNAPSMPDRALGSGGGSNPPAGYWSITDTDSGAQTYIPSGDKSSTAWVSTGTGFGGFFDYYNGTVYTTSFPNRSRRWFPWWTVAVDVWLSADVSDSLRLLRAVLRGGNLRIEAWGGGVGTSASTNWAGVTSSIVCLHPTIRFRHKDAANTLVVASETTGVTPHSIQRRTTTDEGRIFTVATTVFSEGYFPCFCTAPTGLEYHYSLTTNTDGTAAIQGKILGGQGQTVVATFTAVAASVGIKADMITAAWRNGQIILLYRKASDNSVVTLRSPDGITFV